ncbi:MAG: hypothetical protein FWF44_07995, partial [Defluviitaleaceae bacterium]|nr:hypothetical protein [Defluviitaleaceae bacterium]
MSIKQQAVFWLKNVNDYNGEPGDRPALADGYRSFSELMKMLFGDYHAYETSTVESVRTKIGIMADDLENYHNLTDTVDCLYNMADVGVLREDGSVSYLEIEKADFKKLFKGSVTFPVGILENHGFYFRYLNNGAETSAYKNCDKFRVFNDASAELIPAMKHLASALPDISAKDDYIGKKSLLFAISDFGSVLSKSSARQTDISPLKRGIVNTAGDKGELWRDIAESLLNGTKL